MKIMTTYGTLEEQEDGFTVRTVGGKKVSFHYTEVFKNHFKYRHFIDDHNNRRHGSGLSIERTWGTKYWPDRCFAWFLAVSEVNANLGRSFFLQGSQVLPQVNFRKKLAFELLNNTYDVEDTSVGEHNTRFAASIGHSMVTAPHYAGKWLVSENRWREVRFKYQKQFCMYKGRGCKNLTRKYCCCMKVLFICNSCFPKHIIDEEMTDKNNN